MRFNKEIHLLRLTITTECILRCRYCFVRKDNKVISHTTAINTLNLFLNSPGNQKMLIIYGGEPLIYFDLLKKIIIFSKKKAKILKKSLIVSLGTNGILLNQNQLDFFKKHNVKLAISIDGREKFHNKFRIFKNQKGSFDKIFNKIPLILKNIKKENLCILFGVAPSSAYKMYENLIYLNKLGFDSFNIEPIQGLQFKWKQRQKKDFLANLDKIIKYICKNILNNNFIFLNSINRELKNKRLTNIKNICPFFENLEVYPYGEMAFSPFLINSKNKKQYIIGNIKDALPEKYIFCNFNLNDKKCRNCWSDYYQNIDEKEEVGAQLVSWRDQLCQRTTEYILQQSLVKPIFKKYIKKAKKRIFE